MRWLAEYVPIGVLLALALTAVWQAVREAWRSGD